MITLKTYGPSARGDARTVAQQGTIFSADFAAGEYSLGGDAVNFGDLFTHTRGASLRYLDPVSGELVTAGADDPVFLAPDGQRALCLVGAIGALGGEMTTGAGSGIVSYTNASDDRVVPVICFGSRGAEIAVGGDATIVGSASVARPFRPIYVRLTGGTRNITITYNDKMTAYKVGAWEWDEWLPGSAIVGGVAGPRVDGRAPLLAAINGGDPVLDVSCRYIPHGHESTSIQIQNALHLRDAADNFIGLRWNTNTNIWEFSAQQTVATGGQDVFSNHVPLCRPMSNSPRAIDLDMRMVWDRPNRTVDVWANGRQVINEMPTPKMRPISIFNVGRSSGSVSQPRCSTKYLTCRTGVSRYAPNLLTNGGFESGIDGWLAQSATQEWGAAPSSIIVHHSNFSGSYTVFPTEIGREYRAAATFLGATIYSPASPILIRVGAGSSPDAGIADSADATEPGTVSVTFVATSAQSYLYFRARGTATEWTDVSVREM